MGRLRNGQEFSSLRDCSKKSSSGSISAMLGGPYEGKGLFD